MLEDKERWNKKYLTQPMPQNPSKILKDYLFHANVGQALDLACGMGRHTNFLLENGFSVDAVDISSVALQNIHESPRVCKIEADLDNYTIVPSSYDLIVNINFLDRELLPQIKDGLKAGGVLFFETFIVAHGDFHTPISKRSYLLRENELLHYFIGMQIIYYEERIDTNLLGEKVKIASLVAKKL